MRTLRPGVRRIREFEIRSRLGEVHAIRAQDDEFAFGVAWRRRGKLHLSGLARAVRRDGHDDIGEIESASPRAPEHHPRRLEDRRPRRRDENVDLARVRSARPDDEGAVGTAGAAGGDRRQSNETEHARAGGKGRSRHRRAQPAQYPRAKPRPHRPSAVLSRAAVRSRRASPAAPIRSLRADRTCPFSPAQRAFGFGS